MTSAGPPRPRLGRTQTLGRRLPQRADARADWCLQVIDRLRAVEFPLEGIELAAELRGRSALSSVRAIEMPKNLPAPLHDGVVLGPAGLVKEGGDCLVGHRLDAIDAQERRLTSARLDLLHQPLEQFRRLRVSRQDPRRTPEPNGSHPLEFPPHAHAVPRRGGGKARQERQPPHALTVTFATITFKRYIYRPSCWCSSWHRSSSGIERTRTCGVSSREPTRPPSARSSAPAFSSGRSRSATAHGADRALQPGGAVPLEGEQPSARRRHGGDRAHCVPLLKPEWVFEKEV